MDAASFSFETLHRGWRNLYYSYAPRRIQDAVWSGKGSQDACEKAPAGETPGQMYILGRLLLVATPQVTGFTGFRHLTPPPSPFSLVESGLAPDCPPWALDALFGCHTLTCCLVHQREAHRELPAASTGPRTASVVTRAQPMSIRLPGLHALTCLPSLQT